MLQSTGSQRVRHDWVTEQQQQRGTNIRKMLVRKMLEQNHAGYLNIKG